MKWRVKHVYNFDDSKSWIRGYNNFGFFGKVTGNKYFLDYDEHWIGRVTPDDRFIWTAGAVDKGLSDTHISLDIKYPHYVSESPDGTLILTSNGNSKVYKLFPEKYSAELFIDTMKLGITEENLGNGVIDTNGNIWINDIRGCRVWKFNQTGELLLVLGDGTPGFQREPVSFNEVRFNWIYDLRLGSDENIYVLDSKNFAVRMIDTTREVVTTVVGTGKPGYSGDGGDALNATLGSNPDVYYDGPMSLSMDEEGNIFIGDAYNHMLRMVEKSTNIITTIAGKHDAQPGLRADPEEKDPLKLNIPLISFLEYYNGCIFIPEWDGDVIILEKVSTGP